MTADESCPVPALPTSAARTAPPAPGTTQQFPAEVQDFVELLDAGTEAHLAWTRRVLRCAVLHESPGDDVLAADAHCRCRLGRWLQHERARFDTLDAEGMRRLDEQHRRMHDAVRRLCSAVLDRRPGDAADLDTFEQTQRRVVAELGRFKTLVLARSARLDSLTGLPLRYGMEAEFARLCAQAARHGETVVVVLVDIDHFKRVNDTHGHAVGDRALIHVAGLLRHALRAGEPLFRFGGEEFLALLTAVDHAGAEDAAQRLLQRLRSTPLQLDDGTRLTLRASLGLAAVRTDEALGSATTRADRALYAAKHGGRDTWRWADDTAAPDA